MPEIQFLQKPTDAYGKEVKINAADAETATLGSFCVLVLDATLPGDDAATVTSPSCQACRGRFGRIFRGRQIRPAGMSECQWPRA
jgi:hypothetical protein